ncbi:STN domain-containing protein [Microbacteriaceae bacterium K1510]|nr:STN domain-containing protein [Microbacteriaceae bacterium K1510]
MYLCLNAPGGGSLPYKASRWPFMHLKRVNLGGGFRRAVSLEARSRVALICVFVGAPDRDAGAQVESAKVEGAKSEWAIDCDILKWSRTSALTAFRATAGFEVIVDAWLSTMAKLKLRWHAVGVVLSWCALSLSVAGFPAPAYGQSSPVPATRPIRFDIPAQPLESALSAYGATTEIQLFVDATLTNGVRSSAVIGTLTPDEALKALLAGTGLAAHAIGDQGFTLAAVSAERSERTNERRETASLAAQRFNGYSGAIQSAMRGALCRREETVPGTYRFLVRFWVEASGTIVRPEIVTSTGDLSRDAMLSGALDGLAIGLPPPAELPQPVTILLTPGTPSGWYCGDRAERTRGDNGGREAAR